MREYRSRARLQIAAFLIIGSVVDPRPHAQSASRQPHTFLRQSVGFSDAEIAAVDRGQPVTKSLPVHGRREFAVLGVVRVRGPRQRFVDHYRDIVRFRQSEWVPQVGKFSNPPRLEDLHTLTLDARDLRDLEKCRVGDCKVRLPAAGIQRFHKAVDWRSADAASRATAIMKDLLRERAEAYLAGGNAALGQYNDRGRPLRLADELQSLLGESAYLIERVPALHRYLLDFPKTTLPDSEEFLFWAKEAFGLKPVITVTHATIHTPATASSGVTLIATKQIYASHYFDALLGLTTLIDAPRSETGQAFYVLYLNRSLVTRLGGTFGGLIRSRLQHQGRDAMEKGLRLIKKRVEGMASAP